MKRKSAVTTRISSGINWSIIMFQLYLVSGNFGTQKLLASLLDEIMLQHKKFKASKFPLIAEEVLSHIYVLRSHINF